MLIHGYDTNNVPAQFDNATPGRVLILDGDGPCYAASATVKTPETALRRFQQHVLKLMFMTKAESCRIHLTSADSAKNYRHAVQSAKPYQANRTGKAKPALLEATRELVADPNTWLEDYCVFLHRELEADDGMMMDAYALQERGVIASEDKDLRMTPFLYYSMESGTVMAPQPFGWLDLKYSEVTGSPKLIGQGPLFFWAQMLCGDTADNIQGVISLHDKRCGVVSTYNELFWCSNVHEAANTVVNAYRSINQNPYTEGHLLWLLRYKDDSVFEYFNEIDWSKENLEFLSQTTENFWRL